MIHWMWTHPQREKKSRTLDPTNWRNIFFRDIGSEIWEIQHPVTKTLRILSGEKIGCIGFNVGENIFSWRWIRRLRKIVFAWPLIREKKWLYGDEFKDPTCCQSDLWCIRLYPMPCWGLPPWTRAPEFTNTQCPPLHDLPVRAGRLQECRATVAARWHEHTKILR